MLRTIIITLLNIALPFVLRALYIYALRILARKKQKKGMPDTLLPQWHFPIKPLILIGLIFSLCSIAILRFTTTEIDAPYKGNIAKSERL